MAYYAKVVECTSVYTTSIIEDRGGDEMNAMPPARGDDVTAVVTTR
jgi:hypothetical protein